MRVCVCVRERERERVCVCVREKSQLFRIFKMLRWKCVISSVAYCLKVCLTACLRPDIRLL